MSFDAIQGYKAPEIIKINSKVDIGIYYPEKKNPQGKSIIKIYNTTNNSNIQLYSDTLVTISDIFIKSILSNLNSLKKKKKLKIKKKKKI